MSRGQQCDGKEYSVELSGDLSSPPHDLAAFHPRGCWETGRMYAVVPYHHEVHMLVGEVCEEARKLGI